MEYLESVDSRSADAFDAWQQGKEKSLLSVRRKARRARAIALQEFKEAEPQILAAKQAVFNGWVEKKTREREAEEANARWSAFERITTAAVSMLE